MAEPIYTYVKGEGWVTNVPEKWCIVFRGPGWDWENCINPGVYFDTLEETVREHEKRLDRFSNHIVNDNWEFKIVPFDPDKY